MARVYTIDGYRRRGLFGDGGTCKRVRMGRKKGYTIEVCKGSNGRWKFQKGTVQKA